MAKVKPKQSKSKDIHLLRFEIRKIQKLLADINQFSASQNQYYTEKNQHIDDRVKENNVQSKAYMAIKKSIPDLPQNQLLDILSEHVQINHLKFDMVQELITDIYNRLNTIGTSINKSLDNIIDYVDESEKQK